MATDQVISGVASIDEKHRTDGSQDYLGRYRTGGSSTDSVGRVSVECSRALDEMAAARNVKPTASLDDLALDVWADDAELDAFLDDVRRSRRADVA